MNDRHLSLGISAVYKAKDKAIMCVRTKTRCIVQTCEDVSLPDA